MAQKGGGGGGQENGSNTEAIFIVTIILVCGGLWAIWTFLRAAVVLPAFAIDAAFIFLVEHTKGIGQGGGQVKDFIRSFFDGSRAASADITWEQFVFVRTLVGDQIRIVIAAAIAAMAGTVLLKMKGEGLRRTFSLGGGKDKPQSLAQYQAQRWKVATYSAYFDPDNRDQHIVQAKTPMEFLRDNGVEFEEGSFSDTTRDNVLPEIFAAQLGKPWTGLELADLNVQCVAIICALHYLRRKNALSEREILSIAWAQGRDGTEAMKALVAKYIGDADVKKVVETIAARHAYANTALFALLDRSRARAGVLASADFGYLKQLDRSLWYTLSNCGRRRFFIEAAGVVSHYFAEVSQYFAEKVTQRKLTEPNVDNAIKGLEDYLDEQGLLSITEFFKKEDFVS